MKKALFLLISCVIAWAAPYQIGEPVKALTLEDQFGKKHTLKEYPRTVVMAFEKETAATANDLFGSQKNDYLSEHHALYIADISPMPSFIAEAFALPKMRKYPYAILLIRDEETGLKFPAAEGKITILRMEGNAIRSIEYAATAEELKAAVEK